MIIAAGPHQVTPDRCSVTIDAQYFHDMPKEGITPRSQDYAQWYLDIVRGADLADYAEVVRGCIDF